MTLSIKKSLKKKSKVQKKPAPQKVEVRKMTFKGGKRTVL